MKHKFAAQLYTLREELKQDFPAVLRELKQMGWAGVQISGLHGFDAEEIAAVLKETGLGTAGMHVALDRLRNDLDEVLREALLFDTKDLICPAIPPEVRNAEGYRSLRQELNELAARLSGDGYRISYHNHAFEFDTEIEGKSALEYLLEPADDNALLAEIDVYWVKKGGQDPLAFIDTYRHRMPIIHLKDMSADERETFAELGTGQIEFAPLLEWGEKYGVEWYAVEQDQCPGNPLDSLRISLTYLHQLAGAR
ncbi:sugar phosphate isomerase/epimerase family protein [Paenibacillus senegalensis]|uniref:sugar phosphate isomerase/epimerase family protein n=1 Tax=Paenibacillus senegalensis TaxID=1465766 RepID=UPI0002882C0E|nr:sugar phosphate isomerase/epimerase [Paenibacillus senegalensis]